MDQHQRNEHLTSPGRAAGPAPPSRSNDRDRPAIVIRDAGCHGEDLTVPEAVARLRGGCPVTVTVTGPAPPGAGPRPGPGITITGSARPGQPAAIAWDGLTTSDPAGAALFAKALALAGQLAVLAAAGDAQAAPSVLGLHVDFTWTFGAAHSRDRFRRGDRIALEHTSDPHTRLQPGDEGTVTRYDPGHGRLDVCWDNGSSLAMLLHDGDRVARAPARPAAGKGEEHDR